MSCQIMRRTALVVVVVVGFPHSLADQIHNFKLLQIVIASLDFRLWLRVCGAVGSGASLVLMSWGLCRHWSCTGAVKTLATLSQPAVHYQLFISTVRLRLSISNSCPSLTYSRSTYMHARVGSDVWLTSLLPELRCRASPPRPSIATNSANLSRFQTPVNPTPRSHGAHYVGCA